MKHLTLFCFLLFVLNANGQTLPLNQLRADFDYLLEALEEAHGGLYRHHTKDQIDRLFDKYRRE